MVLEFPKFPTSGITHMKYRQPTLLTSIAYLPCPIPSHTLIKHFEYAYLYMWTPELHVEVIPIYPIFNHSLSEQKYVNA